MSRSARRRSVRLLFLLAAICTLAVPASASAAVSTFERFEAIAVADFRITETCSDGRVVTRRVRVTGGHEEETEDGVQTQNRNYMLVQMLGATCRTANISNTFNGPAGSFTWSPSLQRATLTGTLSQPDGDTTTVNMSWDGTGPMQVDQNTATRPGFTGHFTGKRREAVATGTVTLNGETVVNGSTDIAHIETLHDKNISRP